MYIYIYIYINTHISRYIWTNKFCREIGLYLPVLSLFSVADFAMQYSYLRFLDEVLAGELVTYDPKL